MTMGLIVGNRGFFPDHLAKSGREEMLRVLASGRDGCRGADARGEQVRSGGDAGRIAALRRVVQAQPRAHRRRHRHAAKFRRRARHCRHAAPGRSARAGADSGDARRSEEDDHCLPPRQLLRKDVGLQQSAAVRHSVFDHHAAHGEPGFAGVRQRSWNGSPRSAAW